MKRKFIWILVSCLIGLSLVLMSCGQTDTDQNQNQPPSGGGEPDQGETVTSNEPQYGGTLYLRTRNDIVYWDSIDTGGGGITRDLTHQRLWDGDWSKGPAGTGETDWATSYDVREFKMGYIAEKIDFVVPDPNADGKIVYTIRQGIHFSLNEDSEASKLVNGRELTPEDVIAHETRMTKTPGAYQYNIGNPLIREAKIEKTGPWEVTVTVPAKVILETGKRFGDSTLIEPKELIDTYGDVKDWTRQVGTGPFILTDYVAASSATLVKNPDFWMKDPVGPGKGNALPYIDNVEWAIIPDDSTAQAALRTGKIDQMIEISFEDADLMESQSPDLLKAPNDYIHTRPIYMRTDLEDSPFHDVRVRQAMLMATDLVTIERDLYNNTGQILTWPYRYYPAYGALYLGLDDPEMPQTVKDLYTYNPDKAKQYLADAGYPNGFKAELILTSLEADYYSVIKDQWAKAGIDLTLNVMENTNYTKVNMARDYQELMVSATGPPSIWPMQSVLRGSGWPNLSYVDDPYINDTNDEIGRLAITDPKAAMDLTKEQMKYVLEQVYVIPAPDYPRYTFWWPWLKNYHGERSIGYFWNQLWPQWIWLDQGLKTEMGY